MKTVLNTAFPLACRLPLAFVAAAVIFADASGAPAAGTYEEPIAPVVRRDATFCRA